MRGPRSTVDVGRNFSLTIQLVKWKTQICALGHTLRQPNELNCRRTIIGGQNRCVPGLRGR